MNPELNKVESYSVPDLEERKRLSDFAPGIFKTIFSKKGIKKAIKKGYITINGDVGYTSDYVNGGEIIELFQQKEAPKKPIIDVPIQVVYEDDYLAIVNKPAGLLVSGNKKFTLQNALSFNLQKSKQKDALSYPEPIHRLDYPTSGALLIGKTTQAVILLNKMFEEREIQKKYFAITIGHQDDSGIIEASVNVKASKSEYIVVSRLESRKYESLNLVELVPFTGRRHQLRIHLASIGNPILGDIKYGKEGLLGKGNGLYLHAFSLKFYHPFLKKDLEVSVSLPKKFIKLFQKK
ncbi:MAG: RluA family pseudouridine synthase [Flavobacteriaceae bacterium]|nr:RluA family pseudouridine synthase [Flavobacteriaceae bacterium]